jgi:branched-chain amino acid transport system substrate-binding protein
LKKIVFILALMAAVNMNAAAKDTIKIGVYGNTANASVDAAYKAAEILCAEMTPAEGLYEFMPVFFDETDTGAADKINSDAELAAVIGCFSANDAELVNSIKEIPLISICEDYASFTGKGNTYRMTASNTETAAIMARIAPALFDRMKAAVLYQSGNEEYEKMAQAYADTSKRNNVDATYIRAFEPGYDFTNVIQRIREIKVKTIYFIGNQDDAINLCKQSFEKNTGSVFTGPNFIFDRKFIKETKEASDGCEFVNTARNSPYGIKKLRPFLTAYEKKYAIKADVKLPHAYDAINIIGLAAKAGKFGHPDVNGFLKAVSYDGATGKVAFKESGERRSPEFFFHVIRRKEMFYMKFDSQMNARYGKAR